MRFFSRRQKFTRARIPKMYLIYRETRSCRDCGCEYDVDFSRDEELMCFKDTLSTELRWMPIDEKGGFTELFKRLLPADVCESVGAYAAFDVAFEVIQERPRSGGFFHIRWEHGCHKCQSRRVVPIGSRVLERPRLKWMRYDLSRLDSELLDG
jgi:hypothetical protein